MDGDVVGQTGTMVLRSTMVQTSARERAPSRSVAVSQRTAFWQGKSATVALLLFSDKVRWWDCEGGSDGPRELPYALWGHGGQPRMPKDGRRSRRPRAARPAAVHATLEKRAERSGSGKAKGLKSSLPASSSTVITRPVRAHGARPGVGALFARRKGRIYSCVSVM